MRHLYSLPEEMFALRSLEQTDDIFKDFAVLVCFVVLVIIDYCSFFCRLDSFRVAASDVGLVTNVVLEMYNSGQSSKRWFLEKVNLYRL